MPNRGCCRLSRWTHRWSGRAGLPRRCRRRASRVRSSNRSMSVQNSRSPWRAVAPPVVLPANGGHGHGAGGNLVAGGSFYWLRPNINNNTAFVTTAGIGAATTSVSSEDFDWDYLPAAAGWIGWNNDCGVGFRGRYFHFDHDSNTHNAVLDATARPRRRSRPRPACRRWSACRREVFNRQASSCKTCVAPTCSASIAICGSRRLTWKGRLPANGRVSLWCSAPAAATCR